MSALTAEIDVLTSRARFYAREFWSIVSPFERELIHSIEERFALFGGRAAITQAELDVLRDVVDGVEGALDRAIASVKRVTGEAA